MLCGHQVDTKLDTKTITAPTRFILPEREAIWCPQGLSLEENPTEKRPCLPAPSESHAKTTRTFFERPLAPFKDRADLLSDGGIF